MIAARIVSVHCDVPGCGEWTEGEWPHHSNAADVRFYARHHGWRYSGGKDYCPRHPVRSAQEPER